METNEDEHSLKSIKDIADIARYRGREESPSASVASPPAPSISGTEMQARWSTIYHGLTSKFKLKGIEIQLVANVVALSIKTGWCYAGEATLARLSGVTTVTIEKHLKNLHDRGILERGGKSAKGTIKRRLSGEARDYLENFLKKRIQTRNK